MFEQPDAAAMSVESAPRNFYTRRPPTRRQLGLFSALESPVPATSANHGEIFTRRWVVELILNLVGYDADDVLVDRIAIEPACGHGAFLLPMVEHLIASCRKHGRSMSDAIDAIRAYDILAENVTATQAAAVALLVRNDVEPKLARKLTQAWIVQDDFLLSEREEVAADFVIGNPPYIRLEDVSAARSIAYREMCPTMGGRADIFVGFYEQGLHSLKPGGRLAYICADRWMRNAYGKALRGMIAADYAVEAAVTMHDVDAFEDQVAAYPAITVIRASPQGRVAIADTSSAFNESEAAHLSSWFRESGTEPLHRTGLSAAWLSQWFTTQAGWPTGSPDRLALIVDLEERFPPIEDTGAKIGIGLASGADDIYVTSDGRVAEDARMLPMVMRADIGSGEVRWSGNYLVNPWDAAGLVDLRDWPRLAAYFGRHWDRLSARNVGLRNPGREHRTIDRVIEGLQHRPKLLLADMSSRIWPVLDNGKYYPHHNLYWIHDGDSDWDLEVLGGLLLSDVAELFVSTYCVRMRGGTLRFQAQYLRRIRIPYFADISCEDRVELREAFRSRNTVAATNVALRLYGIPAIPT